MAKELKMLLEDGKAYSFRTLTLKETIAVRKETKEREQKNKKVTEIEAKQEKGEELTEDEQEILDAAEDEYLDFSIKVCRMSLAKKHEEFRITGEDKKEKRANRLAINEKISELIDIPTLEKVVGFVMTGTVTMEEEVKHGYTEIIDLTEELNKK